MKVSKKFVALLREYEAGVERETLAKRYGLGNVNRLSTLMGTLVRLGVVEKRPYPSRAAINIKKRCVVTPKAQQQRKSLSRAANLRAKMARAA